MKFDTVNKCKSGWSIKCIEGSKVIFSKNIVYLSLKIDFGQANSTDHDEMPPHAALHQGLCLL